MPAFPVHTSWLYAVLAELFAIGIGVVAGVLLARHVAALDPVDALNSA